MNLENESDATLIEIRDSLKEIHTGCGINGIILKKPSLNLDGGGPEIVVVDNRLDDLVFTLFAEAHNELIRRFKGQEPIELSSNKSSKTEPKYDLIKVICPYSSCKAEFSKMKSEFVKIKNSDEYKTKCPRCGNSVYVGLGHRMTLHPQVRGEL